MSCQQVSRFITTTPAILAAAAAAATTTTTSTATPKQQAAALKSAALLVVEGTTTTKPAIIALKTNSTESAISASTALATSTTTLPSLATAATAEDQDPYVFTESVPATPPILFNAQIVSQKSRLRHIDSTAVAAITPTTAAALPTTTAAAVSATVAITSTIKATAAVQLSSPTQNSKKSNNLKTNINCNTTYAATTTNNINCATPVTEEKNVTQLHGNNKKQAYNYRTTNTTLTSFSPTMTVQHLTLTSPPPSPPQQQNPHYNHHQHHIDPKSLSPNCSIQLTPSLWQTPLLLDTNTAACNATTIPSENAAVAITNSAMLSPPPPPQTITTSSSASMAITAMSGSSTTQPANCLMSSASCGTFLPPSNFHHTTLAQHLHNVECIKKPPKRLTIGGYEVGVGGTSGMCKGTQKSVITPPTTPPTPPAMSLVTKASTSPAMSPVEKQTPTPPLLTPLKKPQQQPTNMATATTTTTTHKLLDSEENQHSDSDINEIPVNVIFRKPQQQHQQPPQQKQQKSLTDELNNPSITKAYKNNDVNTIDCIEMQSSNNNSKIINTNAAPLSTTASPQLPSSNFVTNYNNVQLSPTLVIPCSKVDIDATVSSLQNTWQNNINHDVMPNSDISELLQLEPQQEDEQQHQQQHGKSKEVGTIVIPQVGNIIDDVPVIKAQTPSPPTTTTTGTKKNRKKNTQVKQQSYNSVTNVNHLAIDNGKIVGVVKMSADEIDEDTKLMACETVLPYCVQQHWLATEYITNGTNTINHSNNNNHNNLSGCSVLSREERIAQHKTLLRRQALQLLNTHTLQKLPLLAARKRLICVDRLLRKYDDHNNKSMDVK